MTGSDDIGRPAKLSPREKECVLLVPELISSKAIGQRLNLRPDTVDGYIKSAMRKLGVSDRYAAARRLLAAERPGESPPLFGVPGSPGMGDPEECPLPEPARDTATATVREERSTYDPGPLPSASRLLLSLLFEPGERHALTTLQRIRIIAVWCVIGLLVFCLLLGVLTEFSRTAFDLYPGHRI